MMLTRQQPHNSLVIHSNANRWTAGRGRRMFNDPCESLSKRCRSLGCKAGLLLRLLLLD